ncbi:neprilysin-like [Leptopilina boulardi]|uniref:neprilysin-like n=1 Tax=Leptopilina boulardi TaxID=63433 RepID=UPI0021F5D982|nr:neprilysin-like [Leptopilina boulardi]
MLNKIFFLGIIICSTNIVTASFFNFMDDNVQFHKKMIAKEESDRDENGNLPNNYSVCRTQECFKLASEFWESMNKSVNPCEDFYEFACGGWSVSNPVPPTEISWGTFNVVKKELNLRIREYLEDPVNEDDILPVKQVKKFYSSCMDVDALEEAGIKPIETILSINGGWPIAMDPQEWDPEEFTWQQIDKFYTRLIFSPAFFSLANGESSFGSNHNNLKSLDDSDESSEESEKSESEEEEEEEEEDNLVIMIRRPKLTPIVKMPHGAKFDRNKMYNDGSYAKLIAQIAKIIAQERGVIIDEKQINTDVEGIIDLEKKLYDDNYEGGSEDGTIEKIQKFYNSLDHQSDTSKINWKDTIYNIFSEANMELNGTEEIYMPRNKYLEKLVKILDTTDVRNIVNYVHWNSISRLIEFTNTKMESIIYELNKKHLGFKEMKPRWERCIDNVDLKHGISYQFVKNFFKNKMKEDARKIFENIHKEMIKHIMRSDWLDEKSRKMAIEKMKEMKTIIGYPEWYNNDTALQNHYRGITVGQQFLENKINYMKFSFNRNLRTNERFLFRKEGYWFVHPIVVNAYYHPVMNALVIPAADFLPPFYSPNRPETVNYGFLGSIIGHEVSHGFDDSGIYFGPHGSYANWPKKTEKILKDKMKCYSEQYAKFYNDTSTNSSVLMDKSMITLGENIADSLGVQMMFGAFKEKEKKQSYPRLPGFVELTGDQSFFLSFAKLWCRNTTPEYEKLRQHDSHSEGRYRVISSIQNSEGFAKAFKCPINSPMNPEKKCTIW